MKTLHATVLPMNILMHSVHFVWIIIFCDKIPLCVPGGIKDSGHREGGKKTQIVLNTKFLLLEHPDIGTTQVGGSHVGIGGTPIWESPWEDRWAQQ